MAEQDLTKLCGEEIDNIREVTKWLLAALGAVFAAMMSGFQLRALGFVQSASVSPATWVALGLVVGVIATAVALALRVMVGEGTTTERLLHAATYKSARSYIQANLTHGGAQENLLEKLILEQRNLAQRVSGGRLPCDDPEFVAKSEWVQTLLAVAGWRATLSLFKRLKVTMLLLLPVAAAAAIMVGVEQKTEAAKAPGTPVMIIIPPGESSHPAPNRPFSPSLKEVTYGAGRCQWTFVCGWYRLIQT